NRVLDNKIAPNPGMFALMDNAETVVRGLLAHLKKETDVRPPVKALAIQADAMTSGSEFGANDIVSVVIPTATTSVDSKKNDTDAPPIEIEATPPVYDDEPSLLDQDIASGEDLLASLDLSSPMIWSCPVTMRFHWKVPSANWKTSPLNSHPRQN
ncbi:MAG: hypothetical protein GXP18_07395, partial [Gammaproteobacteria bacterium]|nr:hypothetical protein [Gammaproteobacteria bacterium]